MRPIETLPAAAMALDPKKLREAILFFATHASVRHLGLTKLYKLLYFADVEHLRLHGSRSITGSEYVRYEHGPVPSRGERTLKRMRREGDLETRTEDIHGLQLTAIHALRAPRLEIFSPEELRTLDRAARELGGLTASQLSDRAHREPAWMLAEKLERLDPDLMLYGSEEDPEGL